jgi:uncharacterized protein YndB with AHSA1/START domain
MTGTSTDTIERTIVLKAPRARVWRALTDTGEFGNWFGAVMEGSFVAGSPARGKITHPEYKDHLMEIVVDRIEPETLFSWYWHPAAIDAAVDYSSEPMTHVVFKLDDVAEGTRLTVTETGFSGVPLARQATAYRMNSEGWQFQFENIQRYVG